MKKYETVPHTADVALRVEANTPEELFRGALLGMSGIMKTGLCEAPTAFEIAESISVASIDQSSLLVDFLNEVLALANEDKGIFCDVRFDALTEKHLDATVEGVHIDSFDEDIKAASYHGANIHRNGEGNMEVMVLFDI